MEQIRKGTLPSLTALDWRRLRHASLFRDMDTSLVEALVAGSNVWRITERRVLFRRNEPADYLFVVLEGWVKAFRLDDAGQETILMLFGPSDTVAEAAIFDQGHYPVSAESLPGARLLAIRARDLLGTIEEDPRVALPIIASLSRRLRMVVDDLAASRGAPSHRRLARMLQRLAPREKGPVSMELPFDKSLLAFRLGMNAATLSRAFRHLKPYGVTTRGATVEIAAIEALDRVE